MSSLLMFFLTTKNQTDICIQVYVKCDLFLWIWVLDISQKKCNEESLILAIKYL